MNPYENLIPSGFAFIGMYLVIVNVRDPAQDSADASSCPTLPHLLGRCFVWLLESVQQVSAQLVVPSLGAILFAVLSLALISSHRLPAAGLLPDQPSRSFKCFTVLLLIALSFLSDLVTSRVLVRKEHSFLNVAYGAILLAVEYGLLVRSCSKVLRPPTEPPDDGLEHLQDRPLEPIYIVTSAAFLPDFFESAKKYWPFRSDYPELVHDLEDAKALYRSMSRKDRRLSTSIAFIASSIGSVIGMGQVATVLWQLTSTGPFDIQKAFTNRWSLFIFSTNCFIFLFKDNMAAIRGIASLLLHHAVEVRGTYYELERVGWGRNSIRPNIRPVHKAPRHILDRHVCAFTILTDEEINAITNHVLEVAPAYEPLKYNCQGTVQQILARIYTDKSLQLKREPLGDEYHNPVTSVHRFDRCTVEQAIERQYRAVYKSFWTSLHPTKESWRAHRGGTLFLTWGCIRCSLAVQTPTTFAATCFLGAVIALFDSVLMLFFLREAEFWTSTIYGRPFEMWSGVVQVIGSILFARPLASLAGRDENFAAVQLGIGGLLLVLTNVVCLLIYHRHEMMREFPRGGCLWVDWDDNGRAKWRMVSGFKGSEGAKRVLRAYKGTIRVILVKED